MASAGVYGMPEKGQKHVNPVSTRNNSEARPQAPGRIKISEAVKKLLKEKSYHDITWGEIARTAGVSEALIYQHFGDRLGLLFSVIEELLRAYVDRLGPALQGTYGSLNKLRRIIWFHIDHFNSDIVFAKILLLEVRSYPSFFECGAYRIVQEYGALILDVIKEGVFNGEICDDVAPEHIRQVVLGTIEHLSLPKVIFGREFSTDDLTETACRIIFSGISNKTAE